MPTLVNDPQPVEVDAFLERRRELGQDLFDEVWEGVYHVNPTPQRRHARVVHELAELLGPPAREAGLDPIISPFNLGESDDYRVPDGGLFVPGPDAAFLPTAALVVEVVSPRGETWQKVGFYAAHDVDEVLIVDPEARRVHWLGLGEDGEYRPIERSSLIALGPAELAERIEWPD